MEKKRHNSNRLNYHDYSSNGAYFVTICTHNRKNIFSDIVGAIHESPVVQLNTYGQVAYDVINELPKRYDVEINHYIIMPNHIHLLIEIKNHDVKRAIRESPLQSRSVISKIIGYLKMNVSKRIHNMGYKGEIWQRSFYDHIVRDKEEYNKIAKYIHENPVVWEYDRFYNEKIIIEIS